MPRIARIDPPGAVHHIIARGIERGRIFRDDEVLAYFDDRKTMAQRRYRQYVVKGLELGKQPALTGGGLLRSAGGWTAVHSLRKAGVSQKNDERILGDSDFVSMVLSDAQEAMNKRYLLTANGIQLEDIVTAVAEWLSIPRCSVIGPSKERTVVKGRALVCYWSVRELGMSMTEVADCLKIAVPTVSVAVSNGGKIVAEDCLILSELLNIKI